MLPNVKPSINNNYSKLSYNHSSYLFRRKICRFLLKKIAFTFLTKIDRVEGLENIPSTGPAIIMMNHIAFMDPIVMVYVVSRDIVPLAKEEVYNYPVVGIFPHIWGVIPVKRDTFDRNAIKQALSVLEAGEMLLVAPEGTRNEALGKTREGAAYLASRGNAVIIPAVLEGTNGFPALPFSPRWRETGAIIRFGQPFRFHSSLTRAKGDMLTKMMDEAMYVLAGLLPEQRRGMYSDLSRATQTTFEWVS